MATPSAVIASEAWQSQESKTQKSKGKNKEGFYIL
jgi:hypothetical protein